MTKANKVSRTALFFLSGMLIGNAVIALTDILPPISRYTWLIECVLWAVAFIAFHVTSGKEANETT